MSMVGLYFHAYAPVTTFAEGQAPVQKSVVEWAGQIAEQLDATYFLAEIIDTDSKESYGFRVFPITAFEHWRFYKTSSDWDNAYAKDLAEGLILKEPTP